MQPTQRLTPKLAARPWLRPTVFACYVASGHCSSIIARG